MIYRMGQWTERKKIEGHWLETNMANRYGNKGKGKNKDENTVVPAHVMMTYRAGRRTVPTLNLQAGRR